MRVFTFLMGAAVGMATAMYLNQSNKTVMMGFSQLGDNMSKMMDKAMTSFADKMMTTQRENSLNKVEQLANKDADVKNDVNAILTKNNVTAH